VPNTTANTAATAASFRIPDGGPYLATHSVGCLTHAAHDALLSGFLDPWQHQGVGAWDEWLRGIEDFRGALASLLGGKAGDFCPQLNLSAALSAMLSGMPAPKAGRNVWIAAEESFPSMGFVLAKAEALGFRLRLIPSSRSPGLAESWIEAMTPDVCGVLVTHVFSNTGVVAPVREITRHARAAGVCSVVDIAQSAGILPLRIDEIGADALIGSCVKWLCGGPGAGFLWMREDFAGQLAPTDIGWFSHAAPTEMDIHSFRYARGAQRFWGGTPSVAPYVMAAASIRMLTGIGIGAILDHTRELQRSFASRLPEHWGERVPLDGIGGTLCIPCGESLSEVRRGLDSLGAHYDCRRDVVRLSFHLCNTVADARAIAGAFQ
jgi:kynureninase